VCADVVTQTLAAQPGYRAAFAKAFDGDEKISMARVAQAIATFERAIVSRRSDFDRFLKGEHDAMSDAAVRGLHLFRTDARCANCHMGPTLSDEQFHDLGPSYYGREFQDLGRYEVTKDPKDVGKFKTPSRRNVTRSAPYMHNGLFDLMGVLRAYNAGMATLQRKPEQANDPLFPTKSPHLRPLGLNANDLSDLRAFLESLEETRLRIRPPELPGLSPAMAPATPQR
jgi:cytochrome c peroxidase